MPTSSTVPAFLDSLLAQIGSELSDVQVSSAWPGPNATENESVFIGDSIDNWNVEIPTMKAGRKQRQETYSLTVEAWVAVPGELRQDSAAAARSRAIELIDALDSLLADDPDLGEPILWARLTDRSATLVPFDKGWACQATATIDVEARLT